MSDDILGNIAPKALQAQTDVLTPRTMQARAGALEVRANDTEARASSRMDDLAKQRDEEFKRRTTERQTDADAFKKSSDELIGTAAKPPEDATLPDAHLGPIVDPKDAQGFMFGMLAMTLVGAKGGRQHWDMALAGLDGALQGYKAGNIDRMKEKQAQFKREFDLAIEKQRSATKKYEDILKSKTMSLNQQMEMIRIHAAANEDWALQNAAQMKDVERVYRQVDQARGAASKLEAQAASMQDRIDARHERASERAEIRKAGESSASSTWTPEAIDVAAEMVLAGKPMPAMGSGKTANAARGQVMKRVADLAKERGIAPSSLPAMQAEFKADQASLGALVKQNDAITAFEKTALKNGERLTELADKVDSTGIPVVERWIRAGRKDIAGDVDVSRFNAQIMLFGTEVAKILTNPSLAGQLTDSARHEVSDFLPTNATAPQIKGLVSLLKQDFGNRHQAIHEQIDDITNRLKNVGTGTGGGTKPKAAGPLPNTNDKGWTLHTDAQGNKAYVSPDGAQFEEVSG